MMHEANSVLQLMRPVVNVDTDYLDDRISPKTLETILKQVLNEPASRRLQRYRSELKMLTHGFNTEAYYDGAVAALTQAATEIAATMQREPGLLESPGILLATIVQALLMMRVEVMRPNVERFRREGDDRMHTPKNHDEPQLSTDVRKVWVEQYSDRCPYCDGRSLEAQRTDPWEDGCITQVQCRHCRRRWGEIYALAHMVELDAYGNVISKDYPHGS